MAQTSEALLNHKLLNILLGHGDTFTRQWTGSPLVQIMSCLQASTWTNAALLYL